MGQENEQEAELIATIQHEHVAMKNWYNTHIDAKSLHASYGPTYPAFWRDVVNWDGWKESRKLYLKSIEGKVGSSTEPSTGEASNQDSTVPRKRKSRWATKCDNATGDSSGTSNDRSKRKSRWAREGESKPSSASATSVPPTSSVLDFLPGLPNKLSSTQSEELAVLQKTLRECNSRLSNLESEAARIDALPVGHRERSPSPPPVYGPDGKRKNTRAVRWRERYTSLRQDTLEKILKLTTGGNAVATVAPSLFNRKRTKKIYIPVDEHPTYNFIGLIIGPRGKTQKEMEEKTGCKIAIRGKGSVKEGARGRRDGKIMEGDDEPLHVVVSGDNQESVDNAAKLIEDMLVVIDDDKNIHKQAQLRELALLNGTLKEDEYCSLCAEKGHRAFECPKRFSMNKPSVEVKCAICGDTSHPTRDCKQKDAVNDEKDASQLDSDYLAFMNELDGKPADAPPITDSVPPLQSLVTSIGPDGKVIGGPPLCQTIVSKDEKKEVEAANGTSTVPLITTISSRMVKATAEPPTSFSDTISNMEPSSSSSPSVAVLPVNNAIPSVPSAVVPPPSVVSATPSISSMVVPNIPPPPSALPTFAQQSATSTYFTHQPPTHFPQQVHQQNYHPHQPVQPYGYAGYQQGMHMYQQGYPSQGYQNTPAAGWNYNPYYGGNNNNAPNESAGGFNWWESNDE